MPRPKAPPTRKLVNLRMRLELVARVDLEHARRMDAAKAKGFDEAAARRAVTMTDTIEELLTEALDARESRRES